MANFPQTKQIKTAKTDHAHEPIAAVHQSTHDIFQFGVTQIIPVGKSFHYKFKYGTHGDLQPMPNPTYGTLRARNQWFWVPFRTIFKGWNDMIENNIHNSSNITSFIPQNVPLIRITTIVEHLKTYTTPSSQGSEDFALVNAGTTTYYNFNYTGKLHYKILCQLGYKIPFNRSISNDYLSAMPLLAAARIYCDWFYNGNYKNDSSFNTVIQLLNYDGNANGNTLVINQTNLASILNLIDHTFYDSDWLVDCWDNPEAPNVNTQNIISIQDTSYPTSYVTSPNNGGSTYFDLQNATAQGASGALTQYNVNILKQLTAYVKRNQLAGNDTAKRYLAQFGVQLDSELEARSKRLQTQRYSTEVYKVNSTADTTQQGGDQLGAYAGMASLDSGNMQLEFQSPKEYGFLIEITDIQPKVIVDNGLDPITLMKTKFDFWQPDWDGIGTEPVLKLSAYSAMDESNPASQITMTDVFGFLPRYWRFKVLKDKITGDYINNRYKSFWESFTLARFFNWTQTNHVTHSKDFTQGESDMQQYWRIFYNSNPQKSPEDHINIYHWIEGDLYYDGKNLYDDYDFDENHHKETVSLKVNE